jgi:hypothetical protein
MLRLRSQPCTMTGSEEGDRAIFENNKSCAAQHKSTHLTRLLCKQLTFLTKEKATKLIHKDVWPWWKKHLEIDAKRKAAELEKRRRIELKQQALMKLNLEERRLLGLEPRKRSKKDTWYE